MTCVSRYGCAVRVKVMLVMPGPPVLIPEYDARNSLAPGAGSSPFGPGARCGERRCRPLGVARPVPGEDALHDGDPVHPGPQLEVREPFDRRPDGARLGRGGVRRDPRERQVRGERAIVEPQLASAELA